MNIFKILILSIVWFTPIFHFARVKKFLDFNEAKIYFQNESNLDALEGIYFAKDALHVEAGSERGTDSEDKYFAIIKNGDYYEFRTISREIPKSSLSLAGCRSRIYSFDQSNSYIWNVSCEEPYLK
ncbi:MAG: hypothetical protein IPJ06_15035 [Saprospiraceae bacterium]|nr:hypothetical protein [Saprospiraceae bacterium]